MMVCAGLIGWHWLGVLIYGVLFMEEESGGKVNPFRSVSTGTRFGQGWTGMLIALAVSDVVFWSCKSDVWHRS